MINTTSEDAAAGAELEDGIGDDVDHQRQVTIETIGGPSENQGPEWPHREGQGDGDGHVADFGAKVVRDGGDRKDENEKVEGVQRPPQQAGHERVALLAG